jgi:lipoprotein-anchoring transpeptidase ErfK/SrfK
MQKSRLHIQVSVRDQELKLRRGRKIVRRYPVSTSRFGLGSEENSHKTPVGKFRISDKIGEAMPIGTIFVGRVVLRPDDPLPPTEDLVLSRILWLDGVEPQNANTRNRFIYIHGTRHEDKIGEPDSHGCIRMRNADVIELFDLVDVDTPVTIRE